MLPAWLDFLKEVISTVAKSAGSSSTQVHVEQMLQTRHEDTALLDNSVDSKSKQGLELVMHH